MVFGPNHANSKWPLFDFERGTPCRAGLIATLLLFLPHAMTIHARCADQNGLRISIQADKDKSGTPTIDRRGEFRVVFTNKSREPIRIWDGNCQPGWEALSFRHATPNSADSTMSRIPRHSAEWIDHPLKVITILPGQSFSLITQPSRIWGEYVWANLPEPNTGDLVRIRAEFKISANTATRDHGVWTGEATSDPIDVLVVDAKLTTPNEYLEFRCPKQGLKLLKADPRTMHERDEQRFTPLHHAARNGFVEVATWLLANGANVNASAVNNFTPLSLASDSKMIKLLIKHKADLNSRDCSSTVLQNAAYNCARCVRYPDLAPEYRKWLEIATILVDAGAEYDMLSASYLDDAHRIRALLAENKDQPLIKTTMWKAASHGRANVIKLLLDHGADPEDGDYGGLTLSYSAIQHADILKLLFAAGANPKKTVEYHGNGFGPQGSTLLNEAAQRGALESVKLLVAQGIDVNQVAPNGCCALDCACSSGQVAMVEWLLDHKAKPSGSKQEKWSPMEMAAYQIRPDHDRENAKYIAIIQRLEKAGVGLDVYAAVACNDVPRIKQILATHPKAGMERDSYGCPVLHRAVMLDRRVIVGNMLDSGCDPDVTSDNKSAGHTGETALLQAAFWGRLEIAELLIQHGAAVNAKADQDVVPLHEAARMGHVALARLLLQKGADVNAKDAKGDTPLDWATYWHELPEMKKLLRENGGRNGKKSK